MVKLHVVMRVNHTQSKITLNHLQVHVRAVDILYLIRMDHAQPWDQSAINATERTIGVVCVARESPPLTLHALLLKTTSRNLTLSRTTFIW